MKGIPKLATYYPVVLEVVMAGCLVGVFVLAWGEKMPSTEALVKFLDALNTKGGNLLLLSGFTGFFAIISVRTFLYIIDLSVNGKMNQDNTFALQAIAWVTGGLTTGFMGALLKTMTGDASVRHDEGKTATLEVKTTKTDGI
jgi:hypothetical protein